MNDESAQSARQSSRRTGEQVTKQGGRRNDECGRAKRGEKGVKGLKSVKGTIRLETLHRRASLRK